MSPVKLAPRPRIFLTVLLLVGIATYILIVDLGINAGRIHRGVEVAGVDVGGLTPGEAGAVLRERAERLRFELITFSNEEVVCRFTPAEAGWDPKIDATAAAAHEVGRRDHLVSSLVERAKSWFGGVKVGWRASIERKKLRRTIDSCERQAWARGRTIDRKVLWRRVRRTLVESPRRAHPVPLRD